MTDDMHTRYALLRQELQGGGAVTVMKARFAGKPCGLVVKVFPEDADGMHDVRPLAVLVDDEIAAQLEIDEPPPG